MLERDLLELALLGVFRPLHRLLLRVDVSHPAAAEISARVEVGGGLRGLGAAEERAEASLTAVDAQEEVHVEYLARVAQRAERSVVGVVAEHQSADANELLGRGHALGGFERAPEVAEGQRILAGHVIAVEAEASRAPVEGADEHLRQRRHGGL